MTAGAWTVRGWVPFLYVLARDLCAHPLLLLLLLLVFAILFMRAGDGLGVPRLFWHDRPAKQLSVGGSVAILVTKILYVLYLLDSLDLDWHSRWVSSLPSGALPLQYFMVHGGYTLAVVSLIGFSFLFLRRHGTDSADRPVAADPAMLWRTMRFASLSRVRTELRHGKWKPPYYGLWFWLGAVGAAAFVYFVGWGLQVAGWWLVYHGSNPDSSVHGALEWIKHWVLPRTAGDPSDYELYLAAAMFAGLILLDYLLNVFGVLPRMPGAGLCTLLGIIAAVYGYVSYREFNPTILIVFIAFLLFLGGIPVYKIRFPGFGSTGAGSAGAPVAFDLYAAPVEQYLAAPSVAPVDRTLFRHPGKRPLAIVCVSGGGIRAAVWATRMLCELERTIEGFPSCVPLITGASGGMVGAGYYCSTLREPREPAAPLHDRSHQELIETISRDSLTSVVHRLFFHDLPLTFLPVCNRTDRGRALERVWNANTANAMEVTFADLRGGEEQGWRPSLVFTPMCVEDGRRVLITNADVERLTVSRGEYLDHLRGRVEGEVYSRSAFNFFGLFPQTYQTFKVVTAARMNASFPYVTPAGALPTSPRRRLVDAGYYDNYGGDLAAGWLADCLADPLKLQRLRESISGVVMIEIRDGVSDLTGDVRKFDQPRPETALARGLDELSAPPVAMLAARESVSLFRNDTKLDWLMQAFRSRGFEEGFFTAALFEFTGEASLSWYLSQNERDALEDCATGVPVQSKLAELRKWWDGRKTRSDVTAPAGV